MVSSIAAASVISTEERLDRRGQILAAWELSSDRLDDMLDLGVRFDRPLLGDPPRMVCRMSKSKWSAARVSGAPS